MAERVVDHLEAVEVQEEHRETALVALGRFQGVDQLFQEEDAIGEVGQGVVVGEVLDLARGLRRPLALLVEEPDHHAEADRRLEGDVEDGERGGIEPDPVAEEVRAQQEHEIVELLQPVEEERARGQQTAVAHLAGRRAKDAEAREREGEAGEQEPRAGLHEEAGAGGDEERGGHRADGDHREQDEEGAAQEPAHHAAGRHLAGAEEQPGDLPVAGDDRDRGQEKDRRSGLREMGGKEGGEAAAKKEDAGGPPAPGPVEQVLAPVGMVEAEQHHGEDDGARRLGELGDVEVDPAPGSGDRGLHGDAEGEARLGDRRRRQEDCGRERQEPSEPGANQAGAPNRTHPVPGHRFPHDLA